MNFYVKKLNNAILDMSYAHPNISVIEHSVFGDVLPDEMGRWDTKNNDYNRRDVTHLGKRGLRVFAANVKSAVLSKRRRQNTERFKARGGDYITAVKQPPKNKFRDVKNPWGGVEDNNKYSPLASDDDGDST